MQYMSQKFMSIYKGLVPRIYKEFLELSDKKTTRFLKMGKRVEQVLYKSIEMVNKHKNEVNILSLQRNAYLNHNGVTLHSLHDS